MLYILWLIISGFCLIFYHFMSLPCGRSGEGWELAFGFTAFVSAVSLIVAISVQLSRWWDHANDIERIEEEKKDKLTYEQENKILIEQFKLYLADQYPDHEKRIFENIKPENVTAYMLQYPEIKTNETLAKLCDEIKSATKKVFNCDRNVNSLERKIAVRKRTMWLTSIPILPE